MGDVAKQVASFNKPGVRQVRLVAFTLLLYTVPEMVSGQAVRQPGVLYEDRVYSTYQEDSTGIFTIGTPLSAEDTLHIVFTLPVEAQSKAYRYGNGIREAVKLIDAGLVRDNVLFVQPEFTRIPWYGNHPDNPRIGQENYLLETVAEVKVQYQDFSVRIYLLGFSKSGWGSMSLIFSHPELFDGILIWDAPLSAGTGLRWGMDEVFDNERYFTERYWLPGRLSEAERIPKNKQIVVGGYDNFRAESVGFVDTLRSAGISVVHLDQLNYPHTWDKNWMYPLLQEAQLTSR
jgi:hypothetical protein